MKFTSRSLKVLASLMMVFVTVAVAPKAAAQSQVMFHSPSPVESTFLNYDGRSASAPSSLPSAVRVAVSAANSLQGKPYIWGGGHKFLYDKGYDCSGSVSYVLFRAGLIKGPLTAQQFHKYGAPGPGRFLTLFVSDHHVFMSICGLRFDTSDHGANRGKGPKWRPTARSFPGFEVRHIPGL